ncbi:MAG: YfiR family protein [Pirellulales bacterium]
MAVLVLGGMVLGTRCAVPARADQSEGFISREAPLKALFLYNFGHYVEWPEDAFTSADQPFVIGILGTAPVHASLREIAATRTVAERRIVIKQFASPDAIEPCHILFVGSTVPAPLAQRAVARLKGLPVLTVGEMPGFAAQGGCINFFIQDNKIRFEVNLEAARQQRLKVSAKLLALAKIVP